jgi:hypothetical protein
MIVKLFLTALLCTVNFVEQDNGFIQWSPTRKLNWLDFQASPPKNATNAALTSSSILMKFRSNGEELIYQISCNFEPVNSWGRVKNDLILSHEQGHFDIAEIHARKLNQALKAYHLKFNTLSKDVNAIYQSVMGDLKQMQDLYDEQTDHSRNTTQQKSWLIKIDSYLTGLQPYANYTRI